MKEVASVGEIFVPRSLNVNVGRAAVFAAALLAVVQTARADGASGSQPEPKIRHVIIIMQENRSFDHYFGTYTLSTREPEKPKR